MIGGAASSTRWSGRLQGRRGLSEDRWAARLAGDGGERMEVDSADEAQAAGSANLFFFSFLHAVGSGLESVTEVDKETAVRGPA